MSRRAVLRAVELTKTYRMGEVDVHALRSVDFSLFAGELLVLLGMSGSGKSTLLNILRGLTCPAAVASSMATAISAMPAKVS